MIRRYFLFTAVFVLLQVGITSAEEYPLMNMIADEVIQKYQQSSCEQLWQQKSTPKSARQQEFIELLHSNPQMSTAFINRVAAPIVNKMFQCGMIP